MAPREPSGPSWSPPTPKSCPERKTWYLSHQPAPSLLLRALGERAISAPAELAEVVRLYGLRMWVEQSYKQVKHALGWSDYQVRSDLAIRRHWQLVCCAFSFCWWAYGRLPTEEPAEDGEDHHPAESAGRGKRRPGDLGRKR